MTLNWAQTCLIKIEVTCHLALSKLTLNEKIHAIITSLDY